MEAETQPKLSKRLQLVTLCPLLSGILICTLIIISILFGNYLSWIDETTSYIEDNAYFNLERLSLASSEIIGSKVRFMTAELLAIKHMWESDRLQLAADPSQIISTDNAYSVQRNRMLYLVSRNFLRSIWIAQSKDIQNFSLYSSIQQKIALADIFMRTFMHGDSKAVQIGMIIQGDNLIDYRFPQMGMSFIDGSYNYTTQDCSKYTYYVSSCTPAYQELKRAKHNMLVYNEDNVTKIFINATYGAFVYYLDKANFDEYFENIKDYSFFVSDNTGKRLIRSFPDGVSDGNVWDAIFKDDPSLQIAASTSISEGLQSLTNNVSNATYTVKGFSSEYIGGVASFDFNITSFTSEYNLYENNALAVGALIDKGIVFSTWNDVLDNMINTIIIQMVIFLILLCITIAVAWFLGMAITDRITYPIFLLEEYLRGKISLQAMDRSYNKEVNQILTYLRMLETLEKIIDPNFMQNPKTSVRENNLIEALALFKDIKNRRGKAIVYNLLGNIRYLDNDFPKAVDHYRHALVEIEELAKEVDQQEIDEKNLSDNEKLILLKKAGKDSLSWESEKTFLQESIIDRKQQLCMGLRAELHESSLELSEIRGKLKEIYNYQHEILQYYASTRTYFIRLLKVMVDIAEIFQDLKYYHSGLELLDIVADELKKLDATEGSEIDIDVTRLSRIGVNIKVDGEANKRLHFIIKDISFEKDILAQMMCYRRGLLLLENDKHYEAAIAFTQSIVINIQEKGQFYDPKIRDLSIKALHNLMEKFGLIKEVPDLKEMYNSINTIEDSLIIVLSYDLYTYPNLSEELITFTDKKFKKFWKLGAVSLNPNVSLRMRVASRDLPGRDLEHLIVGCKNETLKESIYDIMLSACNYFDEDHTKKSMLVIICEVNFDGASTVNDLHLIAEKGVTLYILAREGLLASEEIMDFIQTSGITLIEFGGDLTFPKALNKFYEKVKD